MTTPPRPMRADGLRNREKVVAAAAVLFRQEGAQASLEEIARRAGVGSATLHRHFPTRRALLEAVFHDGIADLCATAGRPGDGDPAGELTAWLDALTVHATEARGVAEALLAGPDGGGIAAEDTCHGLLRETTLALADRATSAGALAPDVTADDLLALAHAFSSAHPRNPDVARRLLRLALTGVGLPAGAQSLGSMKGQPRS